MAEILWSRMGVEKIGHTSDGPKIIGSDWVKALERGDRLVESSGSKYITPDVEIMESKNLGKGTVFYSTPTSSQVESIGFFKYKKNGQCFFCGLLGYEIFEISGHPDFPLGQEEDESAYGQKTLFELIFGSEKTNLLAIFLAPLMSYPFFLMGISVIGFAMLGMGAVALLGYLYRKFN